MKTEVNFTSEQAEHAHRVADWLFKQYRFFLPKDHPSSYLSTKVFGDILKLNQQLEDFYHKLASDTSTVIQKQESRHGIVPAKLRAGQSYVDCNRYSGGLDIISIVPLQLLMV